MSLIDPEKIRQICEGVWRDRAAILTGRGTLSGEAALERAAYWRLCKAGGSPGTGGVDYGPFINELARQYRDEVAQRVAESNGRSRRA
ncbi:MAG TPA: hypothetical protein VGX92_15180 [Pyrinomonadaceae bacterium]|jgi:hypothetical protein|nr:hypothetical protein [Pyrinomonadaceae bacterium]